MTRPPEDRITDESRGPAGGLGGQPIAVLSRLGERPVRIDWLGDIVWSSKSGRLTPMVQATCTPFTSDIYRGGRPVSVRLPVALLRLLRCGGIWQNGHLVGSEPLRRERFSNLEINDETTKLVVAGQSSEDPDGGAYYELDFFDFDAHRSHTSSSLARVQVSENVVLLVPSMELVRFYFGASGSLLSGIFSGAFADRRLYESSRIKDDVGYIKLARGIHPMAAQAVARIAFDRPAYRAFRQLVSSGVSAKCNGAPWYPKMNFPIAGRTDLTADGQWIDRGRYRVFIAWRLIQCTHRFPFKTLYYDASDDAPVEGSSYGLDAKTRSSQRSERTVRLEEAARNRDLRPATVYGVFDDEDPFPDLRSKRVVQVRQNASGSRGRSSSIAQEDEEALAVGEGVGGKRRGADVVPAGVPLEVERHMEPRAIEFVRKIVKSFTDGRTTMRAPVGGRDAMVIETGDALPAVWLTLVEHSSDEASTNTLVGVVPSREAPVRETLWLLACPHEAKFTEDECEVVARDLQRSPTGELAAEVSNLQVVLCMPDLQLDALDHPNGLLTAVDAGDTAAMVRDVLQRHPQA